MIEQPASNGTQEDVERIVLHDGKDFEEIVALAKATGTRITNVQR
jgi:hypothetical protein